MAESDEEEDVLVVVEFDKNVPVDNKTISLKILGLESDSPIVQYEKQAFKGEWVETLGTKLLFKESKAPAGLDPVFSPEVPKYFNYVESTAKVLRLEQFVLQPKAVPGCDSIEDEKDDYDNDSDDDSETMDTLQ